MGSGAVAKVVPPNGLDSRAVRFCLEYHSGKGKREAAVAAGYSAKSAHVSATKLLKRPSVQRFLGRLEQALIKETQLTAQLIVNRTVEILTFNPLRYFRPGKEKDGTWEIADPDTLPEWVGQLIKAMKVKRREYDDGSTETYFEVTLMDKDRAQELGARMLGLLTDKLQLGVEKTAALDYTKLMALKAEDIPDTVEQEILEITGEVKE